MKNDLKININMSNEFSLTPVSAKTREKHLAEILDVSSLKNLTSKQRKKEASRPIYLVRYE